MNPILSLGKVIGLTILFRRPEEGREGPEDEKKEGRVRGGQWVQKNKKFVDVNDKGTEH